MIIFYVKLLKKKKNTIGDKKQNKTKITHGEHRDLCVISELHQCATSLVSPSQQVLTDIHGPQAEDMECHRILNRCLRQSVEGCRIISGKVWYVMSCDCMRCVDDGDGCGWCNDQGRGDLPIVHKNAEIFVVWLALSRGLHFFFFLF